MGTTRRRIIKRKEIFDHITSASEPYDFCIVGGGATGLGTAVDAAPRGHSGILVEQADFAKGTSARSTKLGLGPSRWLSKEETLKHSPTVETEGLTGSVSYPRRSVR